MLRFAPLLLTLLAIPAHAEERRYMLSSFDRIRVEGPFQVTVTSGGSGSAVASGDKRAIDSVSIRVDGRTLVIAPGVNGWGGYPGERPSLPVITVSTQLVSGATLVGTGSLDIDRVSGLRVDLALTGAGRLNVAAADADRIEANMIGTGALNISGKALKARFSSNGAGTITAEGLEVGDLTVHSQSTGESSFNARYTATIAANGLGAVRVAGSPTCTIRGSAPVTCGIKRP